MLNFLERSLKKELLDGDNIPQADIVQNMKELNVINTLLGGHRITLIGFKKILKDRKKISVLEIGCGGGDNLKVIQAYCNEHQIEVELTGIDMNADTIEYAKKTNSNIKYIISAYQDVEPENKPDIIFSSLFSHHFSNEELVLQMQWLNKNSNLGFFINDLQRHPLAYHSIKILTSIFSKSYLVKNDAPLSVLRSFKIKDWEAILSHAKIKNYNIKWKWAFRYLIILEK